MTNGSSTAPPAIPRTQGRKTAVIAYCPRATVAHERAIGFTHSHNDSMDWLTALALKR